MSLLKQSKNSEQAKNINHFAQNLQIYFFFEDTVRVPDDS